MRVMVGDDISLLPDLARPIFRAIALAGEYYTATLNETGKVIGIAVWMPAGQDLFSTYASLFACWLLTWCKLIRDVGRSRNS